MKMDKRDIENASKNVGAGEKSGSQLLQFAVICLAIASFFTTAQGMRSYIFNGEPKIAYVTSGAIQGILLALSMNLPRFMRRIWNEEKNKVFIKAIIEIVLLILTGISLFCSSWFSYVYIADTVHKESWAMDSELLVQQIYRDELYEASDYSKAYRTYLEAELGQKILNLQSLANQLPTQASDFNMDWESERQQYASDDTVASSYMATVINQMETAFVTAPSQENRDLAAQAVTEAQTNIESALENEQTRLEDAERSFKTCNDQINTLNQQIANATTQAEIAILRETLSRYQKMQSTAAAQQQTSQQEIPALQKAQGRLNVYAVNLGLSNSTSSISIKRNLLEMQTELFKDDPDVDSLRSLATKTFANLRNAESLSTDSEGESSLSYSNLLTQMNLFSKVRSGKVRVLLGSTAKMGAGTNVQTLLVAVHHLDVGWRPSDMTQRNGRIIRQGNKNKQVYVYNYVTEGTFDAYLWQTLENKQKFISQIMTSKSPMRSCDDVDEQALSYAEVKALCAGDPRIREKMDLDVQVAKLKVLRSDYQNQKYRLEDKLLKHYPEEIQKAKNRIAALKNDAQIADAHPQDKENFCGMTIKGMVFDEKKAAGERLMLACKEMPNADMMLLGTYRGFELNIRFDSFKNEHQIVLRGELSYPVPLGDDPRGNIVRLDNAIDNFADRIADAENALQNLEQQKQAAEVEVAKPFAQEEELAEKSARLAELDALLNMEHQSSRTEPEAEEKPDARPSVLAALEEKADKVEPVRPFKSYLDKDGDAR